MRPLAFDEIHKSYGETVALRGVSLAVDEGEVFGLLGPNGAGKTTLIRILMDIIRADSGSVELFGRPYDRAELGRVGYLPEERGLYTKQKVLRVMTYFGTLKGLRAAEARASARRWLQKVGLPEVADWRVERLSKGMSQKVQLAATLMVEPEVCVLDEPFSGLDPINVRLVQELIHERRDAGKTTILSTHQMNQVEALCDRVALIDRGRLLVYGTVDDVRREHSLPEVLVGCSAELPAVPGVATAERENGTTWRLLLDNDTAPHEVLRALIRAGVEIERFDPVLAPMDEIFVRVVQEGAS